MMLLRTAILSDLDAIEQLASGSGFGMTTFPKKRSLLEDRLRLSEASNRHTVHQPGNEYYFFVLEDPQTQHVVGTSAIVAYAGFSNPFYSYKISKESAVCHSLSKRNDDEVLHLVNDNQNCSELCTLFLDAAYRKKKNATLLSKSRLLFIANEPQRFQPTLIAEMRGLCDEEGRSPFWEALGRQFFHLPFEEADRLAAATNKQYIADLMPKHPIYVKLLPKEAQAAIGQAHPQTLPALHLLYKEGFSYKQYIDIFDAGPTIEAPLNQIKTIALSQLLPIELTQDSPSEDHYLLANTLPSFKATLDLAILDHEKKRIIISKQTAALLQVRSKDQLRIALPSPS